MDPSKTSEPRERRRVASSSLCSLKKWNASLAVYIDPSRFVLTVSKSGSCFCRS